MKKIIFIIVFSLAACQAQARPMQSTITPSQAAVASATVTVEPTPTVTLTPTITETAIPTVDLVKKWAADNSAHFEEINGHTIAIALLAKASLEDNSLESNKLYQSAYDEALNSLVEETKAISESSSPDDEINKCAQLMARRAVKFHDYQNSWFNSRNLSDLNSASTNYSIMLKDRDIINNKINGGKSLGFCN